MSILAIIGAVLEISLMLLGKFLTDDKESKAQQQEAINDASKAVKDGDYEAYLDARAKFFNA